MSGGRPPADLLETSRLLLTPLGPADFAEMRRLQGDPTAMVTLSADGRPFGEAATSGFLERCGKHWADHGIGVWSVRRKDAAGDAGWIGYAGVRRRAEDAQGGGAWELIYGLILAAWGGGYAAEAAAAALDHARARGVTDVVCYTLWSNRASQRVMRKLGFGNMEPILHAGLPHVLMRLG